MEDKNHYESEINKLLNEIELLKNDKKQIAENIKLQELTNYQTELAKLKENHVQELSLKDKELAQKNEIINANKLEVDNLILKQQNEIKDINSKHLEELETKQKEIDEIKRNRNLLGTKQMGNELENWCKNEIQSKLIDVTSDGTIKLDKYTSVNNNNSLADFIVTFKSNLIDDEINKNQTNDENNFIIVLEMKTETFDSQHKTTNLQHIKKLVKDATTKNASVAILVTELEKDDKFWVKRIDNKEYETDIEIFMARPEFLVYLLSILRIIYLKYVQIKQRSDYEFKQKDEILNDFNKFKQEILDIQIKNINSNLEDIKKDAEKIVKCANNILDKTTTILDTHINRIENKINSYKIENKVIKKIEKLNQ